MATLKLSTAYPRSFPMYLSAGGVATTKTVTVYLGKGSGAAGTIAAGAISELDATHLPGQYQIALTSNDTNTLGDLTIYATAAACSPTIFVDQVQTNIFTDLSLSGAGLVSVTSNIKQNTIWAGYTFVMTVGNPPIPTPGLTVTAQRNLSGAGFAPCANAVSDLGNGFYDITLAATDTNAAFIMLKFTAPGANDLDILQPTQA